VLHLLLYKLLENFHFLENIEKYKKYHDIFDIFDILIFWKNHDIFQPCFRVQR